ncbi:MAG: division/cell wall cluster transcriptional repressor MraZ [Chloroflexota bacterium]
MFLGEFAHSLDDKGRLAVPSRFRQDLADGLYLSKGVDRCLYIHTPEAWNRLAERIAALSAMQANARQIQRHFFAGATPAVPDKLGRIVVPASLREYAQLTGNVIVAGVYSRIEVWDEATWNAERDKTDAQSALLAEDLAGLSL